MMPHAERIQTMICFGLSLAFCRAALQYLNVTFACCLGGIQRELFAPLLDYTIVGTRLTVGPCTARWLGAHRSPVYQSSDTSIEDFADADGVESLERVP